ncbi:MAG: acyltransferase domain-containing protein [Terriglobia bacterium]
MREGLAAVAEGKELAGVQSGHADLTHRPEVVFLFTGQGGQYVNMGRGLYESEPTFRGVLEECEEKLRPYLEKPLLSVLYPGAGEGTPLDETGYTHVAMFAIQYGLAKLWRSWGIEPGLVMGHSVGEIVAATVAGVMSLEEGLKLMRERGRLMQRLPRNGMMASLLMGEERVVGELERYRGRVAIAAVNGPESTVISGERGAVEEILRRLEGTGVKVKVLKVSNAFHSPLVEPVLEEFERVARGVEYRAPEMGLFSSMKVGWVKEQGVMEAGYWVDNLRHTVRFSEAIRAVYERGYRVFLEIGPTPILVSMGSQCVPMGEGVWLPSLREGREDWDQAGKPGHIVCEGSNIDWKHLINLSCGTR